MNDRELLQKLLTSAQGALDANDFHQTWIRLSSAAAAAQRLVFPDQEDFEEQ